MLSVTLLPNKKIYFASDFHFGIPNHQKSVEREKKVCAWLDQIKSDAQQLYLVGDLFDSWIEYKKVVPAGHVRFIGKLAELSDYGIEIIIFTGNHDLWMSGYFEKEINAIVYKTAQTISIQNKIFHIAHGDGVCSLEKKYLRIKKLFHHPFSQWLYRLLHPDIGLKIADYFSRKGEKHRLTEEPVMKKDHEEFQLIYAKECLAKQHYDYFVFGHRHIPVSLMLQPNSQFVNLGDWLQFNTYAVFDGFSLELKKIT